jgi:hypothetical protein
MASRRREASFTGREAHTWLRHRFRGGAITSASEIDQLADVIDLPSVIDDQRALWTDQHGDRND